MSGDGTPGSALAMGRDSVQVRLDLLARRRRRPDPVRSLLAYGAACAAAMMMVPAIAGLLALIMVVCRPEAIRSRAGDAPSKIYDHG